MAHQCGVIMAGKSIHLDVFAKISRAFGGDLRGKIGTTRLRKSGILRAAMAQSGIPIYRAGRFQSSRSRRLRDERSTSGVLHLPICRSRRNRINVGAGGRCEGVHAALGELGSRAKSDDQSQRASSSKRWRGQGLLLIGRSRRLNPVRF